MKLEHVVHVGLKGAQEELWKNSQHDVLPANGGRLMRKSITMWNHGCPGTGYKRPTGDEHLFQTQHRGRRNVGKV